MAFEYQGFATLGVNLNRQKYGPLDISNVFTSEADLKYYLTKGAYTEGVSEYWTKVVPYPYEGQVLATVIEGKVAVYALALDAEGNFVCQNVGDTSAVEAAIEELKSELNTKIGTLPEGSADVISYINKKTEGIATDAALGELQQAVESLDGTVNGKDGLVATVENLDGRIEAIESDYLVEADLTDYAKTADVVAKTVFEDFQTTNTAAIATAKSEAEATAASKLAEARTAISAEIDEDVKVAKDRADAAYALAETKVAATIYAEDKKALEDEDAAIRSIAEEAKSKIDTFLTSEDIDDTVNTLKEIKAELDKMADSTEMVTALAGKADKAALEGVEQRVGVIESKYATKDDVSTVDSKFNDYTKTSDLTTLLAGKQDVISEGTYATPANVETAKSEAISAAATDAQTKADAAKAAAIADADTKLSAKANVADVYTKSQVYNQDEIDELLENIQAGSSESAASVKTQLDSYKKVVNTEVWGNEEGTGDSRIDKLEAVGAQANVIESVVGATDNVISVTKSGKEVTIDDSALVELVGVAKARADKGVEDAAAASAAVVALADGAVATNASDISAIKGRLTTLETAKGDHETRISTVEGKVTSLETANQNTTKAIGVIEGTLTTLSAEDTRLAGLIDTKADASAVYTKAEADKAIEDAIKAIPAVDLSDYAKTSDVESALGLKADAADVYTKTEADATFMSESEVDARINALIVASDPEGGKTITNIQNLVKYVDENASEIAELVTTTGANTTKLAGIEGTVKAYVDSQVSSVVTPKASDEVTVADDGTLGIGEVNVSKLVQDEDSILVLNGGSAS